MPMMSSLQKKDVKSEATTYREEVVKESQEPPSDIDSDGKREENGTAKSELRAAEDTHIACLLAFSQER